MKFITASNYEEMSELASETLLNCLIQKPDALFCIATGGSPTLLYKRFVQKIKKQNLDTSHLKLLKLDEWFGLSLDNPASCEYYIQEHLITPLNISPERYISFNSLEKDSAVECQRITDLIASNNGIDCCILGLGKNGHLGLNEPAESINPFAHKAILTPKTKEHSMLTSNSETVSEGYTLGLKNILDSKKILLLVTGEEKNEAFATLQKPLITSQNPANYLWLHDDTTCFVDNSSFLEANN